jgi:tetratricopeptide (TPR) repeat protein
MIAALDGLGLVAHGQGDYRRAAERYEAALALAREAENRAGVVALLDALANLAVVRGDYARAAALYEQVVDLYQELGNKTGAATALSGLGVVTDMRGDHARGLELVEQALAVQRDLRNVVGASVALYNLGEITSTAGEDLAQAAAYYQESLDLSREQGNRRQAASSLHGLAEVAQAQGDAGRAAALYRECLALFWELGDRHNVAFGLEGLAKVAASQGLPTPTVRLYGVADAIREAAGAPLPPENRDRRVQDLADARHALGEAAFTTAWEAGRSLPLVDSIAFALAPTTPVAIEPGTAGPR